MHTQEEMQEIEQRERIRRKYRSMLDQLYRINNKMSILKKNYKDYLIFFSNNIQIDGDMFDNDEFNGIKEDIEFIHDDLNNKLISMVSRKI